MFVAAGAEWRYMKGLGAFSDPPLAWVEEDFDDSAWLVGASGFGFDDDDDNTILDDMRSNYTSVALRTTFEVTPRPGTRARASPGRPSPSSRPGPRRARSGLLLR